MNYQIKRDDKEYGPYSLVDLQRYVKEGSISPSDLARSEGMVDWVPVSQIVGDIAVPQAAPPAAAAGSGIEPGASVPESPGWHSFHWALVLLLTFVTCGFLVFVWMFVQAIWARKVVPDNKAPILYATYLGLYLAGVAMMATEQEVIAGFGALLWLAGLVCLIWGHFQLKSAIEDYYSQISPYGRQLSGVMTFFFNVWYFQYHFNEISSGPHGQSAGMGLSE